jgi:hypothetical protein
MIESYHLAVFPLLSGAKLSKRLLARTTLLSSSLTFCAGDLSAGFFPFGALSGRPLVALTGFALEAAAACDGTEIGTEGTPLIVVSRVSLFRGTDMVESKMQLT